MVRKDLLHFLPLEMRELALYTWMYGYAGINRFTHVV